MVIFLVFDNGFELIFLKNMTRETQIFLRSMLNMSWTSFQQERNTRQLLAQSNDFKLLNNQKQVSQMCTEVDIDCFMIPRIII